MRKRWTAKDDAFLQETNRMSMAVREMARRLECTEAAVHRRRWRLGLQDRARDRAKHGYNRDSGVRSEYQIWAGMLSRCHNLQNLRYGGRGITVCDEWLSFPAFIRDMGDKPTPLHTLERKDNNGPYAPWNCKWATRKEQANNRRNNKLITFADLTLTISQWADYLGKSRKLIQLRLCRKEWTITEVLLCPVRGGV